jgi:hypothetical protein
MPADGQSACRVQIDDTDEERGAGRHGAPLSSPGSVEVVEDIEVAEKRK